MPALPDRVLCLVTAVPSAGRDETLLAAIDGAVRGGADMVQVRAPGLAVSDLLELATEVVARVGRRALVIINDRVDVALAVGAAGVQLGEQGLTVSAAREAAADRLLIGRSVHSAEGAEQATAAGADFLVLGTVFTSISHPGRTGAGVDLVRRAASVTRLPLLGIGGITPGNAGDVVAAGARGVAVISAILSAPDPERAARDLRKAIG